MESAPVAISLTTQANSGEGVTTAKLSHIWQEQLGIESASPDQSFFDLGGDSSLAVRMFAEIEKVFGVKLPLATLYDAPTVAELARVISGEVESTGWSPLVAIQTQGSRPPLFCMHGAGGTVLMYRDLSQRLGEDQPFYGLQAQGLDGSLTPLTLIEEMAALYIKEIRKVQAMGPYFISGYCMGGTVAYEVGQQLQQQGETVAMLALFDTMNWHRIPLHVWSKSWYWTQRILFHAGSFFGLDSAGKKKFFREKLEVLENRIPVWQGKMQSALGMRPKGVESHSLLLARIWQLNDKASWNYIAKAFPGIITDIRPAKQYWMFDKPEYKWKQLARGGEKVIVLPVNPASMLVEPFVEHLAIAVRQAMDEAIARYKVGT
jgi:phthiocerol/phenolphthiocerol synthesis type-I polyketide synthase E